MNTDQRIAIHSAVTDSAQEITIDPEVAATLILANPTKYGVSTNSEGVVTGVDNAVHTLIEAFPFLNKNTVPSGLAAGRALWLESQTNRRVLKAERR